VEYVTQIPDDTGDPRAWALLDRLDGPDGQVRSQDSRVADAAFDWLVAGKQRLQVPRVWRHVCRHDEGVGDCRGLVVEG
jgi:hypothetical protein